MRVGHHPRGPCSWGNAALKAGDYDMALALYTEARPHHHHRTVCSVCASVNPQCKPPPLPLDQTAPFHTGPQWQWRLAGGYTGTL